MTDNKFDEVCLAILASMEMDILEKNCDLFTLVFLKSITEEERLSRWIFLAENIWRVCPEPNGVRGTRPVLPRDPKDALSPEELKVIIFSIDEIKRDISSPLRDGLEKAFQLIRRQTTPFKSFQTFNIIVGGNFLPLEYRVATASQISQAEAKEKLHPLSHVLAHYLELMEGDTETFVKMASAAMLYYAKDPVEFIAALQVYTEFIKDLDDSDLPEKATPEEVIKAAEIGLANEFGRMVGQQGFGDHVFEPIQPKEDGPKKPD